MSELFKTAPEQVIRYFDERGIKTSFGWKDFASHQHALDFTVARTAGFDVINNLHDAVRKAVVDRVPFEQFQRELVPILQQKGWWGKQLVEGPSGKKELVQLGSTRRLQTIYWANTASAHAAGEWARTQETKDFLPFLQYKVSLSERRRKEHEGWVGITLPVDDPWWRTHYPPNGWHCKCRVEQIGETRAGRASPDKRRAPPLNPRNWKDKRTGKVWRVPEGIDPGWQRNSGVTREIVAAAEQRRAILAASRPGATVEDLVSAAQVLIKPMLQTPEFRAVAGNILSKPVWKKTDVFSDADRAYQKLRAPVAVINELNARRLGVSEASIVELTGADAPKMAIRHNVTIEQYALVQEIINAPDGVRLSGGKFEFYKLVDGRRWIAVLKAVSDDEVFLNSYRGYMTEKQWQRGIAEGVTAGLDYDN